VVDDKVKRFGSGSVGPQQRQEFLKQLLYLGWESSKGGSSLRALGFNKSSCTSLGEGVAQGRVQSLLFIRDHEKVKMDEKIPVK
jgi:hypothetical protein